MKKMIRFWACAAAFCAAIASASAASKTSSAVTVNADGSVTIRSTISQARAEAETTARQMQMALRYEEGGVDVDDADVAAAPEKKQDEKPLTDAELEKVFRSLYERDSDSGSKIESIQVGKDEVNTVFTNRFETLEEAVGKSALGSPGMSSGALYFQNTKVEKDTNSHLKITLTPNAYFVRRSASLKRAYKQAGVHEEFTLALPGKILSSDFPQTKDNATGYVFDTTNAAWFDLVSRLQTNPVVIVAELGGLKLDQPLDSKNLRAKYRESNRPDASSIPITDAGPGFLAEPAGVTVTTVHYFTNGQTYMKKAARYDSESQPGVVVACKLFCPKDRTMENLSGVRVIAASDSKGRPVPKFKRPQMSPPTSDGDDEEDAAAAQEDGDEEEEFSGSTISSGGESKSIQFDLRLALPASDADSIASISGEAIALTTASWKQMELAGLQPGQSNQFDLSSLVPGAVLRIKKYTLKNSSAMLQAQFEGPEAATRLLKVQLKFAGDENTFNSSSWDGNAKKNGTNIIRSVNVNGYHFLADGGESSVSPKVSVVLPVGQKRERVKFELSGLDLF